MSRERNHPDDEHGAARRGDDHADEPAYEAARPDLGEPDRIEDIEFTGRVVGQFQTD